MSLILPVPALFPAEPPFPGPCLFVDAPEKFNELAEGFVVSLGKPTR
jgi:hypothetical protein